MLHKVKGIVLSYIRYRETSIIVKIFTDQFGLQSYIVNGARSKKGSGKMALFQPMTILDLVVYKNDQKSIQRISECKCDITYESIPFDIRKISVAIFWAEILSKTLTSEGMEDRRKFEFVKQNLYALDAVDDGIEHCPAIFMFELAEILGFAIPSARNLAENYSNDMHSVPGDLILYFESFSNVEVQKNKIGLRKMALDCLINYYQEHFDGFGSMKSTDVLRQVFS